MRRYITWPLGLGLLVSGILLGQSNYVKDAWAQAVQGVRIINGSTAVSGSNPLPVTGSFSASIAGFNWESNLTPLSVTTSSGTSGAFTAGKVVILSNVGTTNNAYCKLGASATTSATPILPGQSVALSSISETTVACITSASTTTVNVQVGTGLPTGWGGSGSGGGGGAITIASGAVASGAYSSGSIASGAIASGAVASGAYTSGAFAAGAGADGWDVVQGTTTDAAATAGGTGTVSAKLRLMTTQLGTIATNTGAALPTQAASVSIGGVGLIPNSTNACTPGKLLTGASTNATSVKNSAGVLCKVVAVNTTTTIYYLKFYNVSSSPTCNSDTVVATYPIPPASTSGQAGGIAPSLSAFGEAYTVGIGFCVTGGLADNDNTSAAAGVAVSYSYK